MEQNIEQNYPGLISKLTGIKEGLNRRITSLISKLTEFWEEHNKQIKVGLAAGLMTVSLSACELETILPTDGPNPPYATSPTGGTNTRPGTSTNPTDGTQQNNKYSALLNNLLNDAEVKNVINSAKQDRSIIESPLFDSHPFHFLETQGHDVASIKAGELECFTQTFVKEKEPNNLYMLVAVENEGPTPYFTEYLLKYALTKQEMNEYTTLNTPKQHNLVDTYIHPLAFFMNDKISQLKEVKIVTQTNISKKALVGLTKAIQSCKKANEEFINVTYDNVRIMLKEYNQQDDTFTIYVYPYYNGSVQYPAKITEYKWIATGPHVTVVNGIYTAPLKSGELYVHEDFVKIAESKCEDITIFSTQAPHLKFKEDLALTN